MARKMKIAVVVFAVSFPSHFHCREKLEEGLADSFFSSYFHALGLPDNLHTKLRELSNQQQHDDMDHEVHDQMFLELDQGGADLQKYYKKRAHDRARGSMGHLFGMGGDRDGEQEMSTIGMLPGSIQLQSGSPGAHHMMRGSRPGVMDGMMPTALKTMMPASKGLLGARGGIPSNGQGKGFDMGKMGQNMHRNEPERPGQAGPLLPMMNMERSTSSNYQPISVQWENLPQGVSAQEMNQRFNMPSQLMMKDIEGPYIHAKEAMQKVASMGMMGNMKGNLPMQMFG